MPRAVQVSEVPGVEEALGTRDPIECARRIRGILGGGADRKDVAGTAALASARHFRPTMPPPHALLALSAALDLSGRIDPPELPLVQACAVAAAEWHRERLPTPAHAVAGDELHLGRSFQEAVRGPDPMEVDAIFSGLLREGEERRLAGDTLFEACAQDTAGEGHKLTFAVGSWRLARSLGWLRGPVLLRPAVRLAASAPQELGEFSTILREVGRSRLDLELAGRNVAPIDAVARNGWQIALNAGPDRVVTELIAGLKRGRSPSGYADLVAATAAERLAGDARALEPVLSALAVRFVVDFTRTSARVLAVLQAARAVARLPPADLPEPARISNPDAGRDDLGDAIGQGDVRESTRLARGLADVLDLEILLHQLRRIAITGDAHEDAGHRLLYTAWASEFAPVAPGPVLASLAAVLARGPRGEAVFSTF